MSLWKIAWRSIQRRGLASALTTLSMSLGVFLIVGVLLISGIITESFRSNASLGYNMIIGADKGGRIQVVMNTVYYLSSPVENISFDLYHDFLSAGEKWKYFRQFNSAEGMRELYSSEQRQAFFRAFVNGSAVADFLPEQTTSDFFADCLGGQQAGVLSDLENLEKQCRPQRWKLIREFLSADEIAALLHGEEARAKFNESQRFYLFQSFFNKKELAENWTSEAPRTTSEELGDVEPKSIIDLIEDQAIDGRFAPYTAFAIPVCLGDYYRNFRVVGTTPELFDDFVYDAERGRKYEIGRGRNFRVKSDEHGFFEAVIGSKVARKTGLQVGDTFNPTHGSATGDAHDAFTVVGILAPSGTPNDRAVFVNMEGFFLLEGHALDPPAPGETENDGDRDNANGKMDDNTFESDDALHANEHSHEPHQEALPLDQRQVTAVLLRTVNALVSPHVLQTINRGEQGQAVQPIREIHQLFTTFVEPLKDSFLIMTIIICLVSGVSILVSIYNSMNDRKHEIAVMRALGAGRRTVMLVVLLESVMLSIGGGLVGWIAGHLVIGGLASPYIEEQTGVRIGILDFAPTPELVENLLEGAIISIRFSSELLLIPGLILLAVAVGFMPALAAYRTDVSRALN